MPSGIYKHKSGKEASNYKGNKAVTRKIHYCIVPGCNHKICYINWLYGNKRCSSCGAKERLKNPKNHPMFGIRFFGKDNPNFDNHKLAKENNPNWLDGIDKLGYSFEFNNKLKEQIRKRDNYICQKCGVKQENYYRKLDVHHIDYDKDNLNEINLISLCSSCNLEANFNRDYWYAYFMYILKEKIK